MDKSIMKKALGNQLKTLREQLGVKRFDLEKRGIHPSLPVTIEEGKKGYSMDSLEKYVNAINEVAKERVSAAKIKITAKI